MATPVNMKVYANDDDALIIWNVPAAIPDCLGFAIQRRTYDPADPAMKTIAHEDVLPNRIGFVDDPNAAPGSTALSTVWPFQRFWWTDHAAAQGDILSYRVIPMVGTVGQLSMAEDLASEWSPIRVLSAPPNSRFNPFFNRGFVISQFMARYLDRKHLTPEQFKANISTDDEDVIRKFLYGYLGPALFSELRDAASSGGEIFAALYELDDDELIDLLCALGARAHVVLSNGSIKKKKTETTEEARSTTKTRTAAPAYWPPESMSATWIGSHLRERWRTTSSWSAPMRTAISSQPGPAAPTGRPRACAPN